MALALATPVFNSGCATYEPKLDRRRGRGKACAARIAIQAGKRDPASCPKAIEFDFQITSPDEAAILAFIANPKLRSTRDQRKLAAAHLLQAGILPNPQFSYALGVPTGGATQGTVNAFNYGPSWEITSIISRDSKIAAARADAVSVDLDVAWQEWQAAQAAKLRLSSGFLISNSRSPDRKKKD
jgi:hypothetical protein